MIYSRLLKSGSKLSDGGPAASLRKQAGRCTFNYLSRRRSWTRASRFVNVMFTERVARERLDGVKLPESAKLQYKIRVGTNPLRCRPSGRGTLTSEAGARPPIFSRQLTMVLPRHSGADLRRLSGFPYQGPTHLYVPGPFHF